MRQQKAIAFAIAIADYFVYLIHYTFMKDLRLTEHFTLAEFERSATAKANGIDNRVPSQYVPALEQLCKTISEPLRAYANSPEDKQSLSPSQ